MVNIFGYISESKYIVPSTGKNKTRLRLDQLGLSLLRGLHVCFVSFEGLTHAKQGKVADWKHQTPIQPKHEATSRSSCRRCLSSASSACSTCPHLQSQAITDQWWIAPLGHRICLKNPKTMHSLAPKNWFQNDIEIQIRHVSPPVHWNSAAEEGAWVGLKPDLQGGTGFNLLRVHFLDPRAKETCFKKESESGPLKSKVVPPGGSSYGPFLAPSMWQICWGVYFKSKLIWPATAAAGILNWGNPFLRACFFLRFEVQKRAPSLSYCFAPISIALTPSRPAAKPALTCFVLISMVLRHWSSRLAWRPASNFVSSYNFFGLLQFP